MVSLSNHQGDNLPTHYEKEPKIMTKLIIPCVLVLALMTSILAGCCGEKTTPTAVDGEVITGEATVESIEILLLESFPIQVNVVALGNLPDNCTEISEITKDRDNNTFRVTIITSRPMDKVCAEVLVPFKEVIPLDVMGLPAGVYTVNVNGVRDTFEFTMDNAIAEPAPTSAGEGNDVYKDPNGLFSVPIPTNWSAESANGYGILTSPDGGLRVLNQLVRYRLLELLYQQELEVDEMGQFQIEMIKGSIAELMAKIQESVDPEPIEPHLGRYKNEALGEVIIEWRDDKLIFDSGEFQAEIRSKINDEGTVSYVLYDSVLTGLAVELKEDEGGNQIMVIGSGVNEYTFEKVEQQSP